MADIVTVDGARLRAGADAARQWVTQVQGSPAGGTARAALVHAEDVLSGSRTAPALAFLAGGLEAAAGQVVTALQGLAAGLDAAAAGFHQVDVVTGAAAEHLGGAGPGQGGP